MEENNNFNHVSTDEIENIGEDGATDVATPLQIEEDKPIKAKKKHSFKWLDGIEEKPRKLKETPDVNVLPQTKGAKFFRGLWSYILSFSLFKSHPSANVGLSKFNLYFSGVAAFFVK